MKFTWDTNKAEKVKVNHKVEFEKIQDIFEDDFSLDYEDDEHSTYGECRIVIVGKTAEYGLVHLVYTIIGDENIRFITARRAEKWLVKRYEENIRRL
jgi:uncharacterized DUF497 family protein